MKTATWQAIRGRRAAPSSSSGSSSSGAGAGAGAGAGDAAVDT